jgi:hypothetical protein
MPTILLDDARRRELTITLSGLLGPTDDGFAAVRSEGPGVWSVDTGRLARALGARRAYLEDLAARYRAEGAVGAARNLEADVASIAILLGTYDAPAPTRAAAATSPFAAAAALGPIDQLHDPQVEADVQAYVAGALAEVAPDLAKPEEPTQGSLAASTSMSGSFLLVVLLVVVVAALLLRRGS